MIRFKICQLALFSVLCACSTLECRTLSSERSSAQLSIDELMELARAQQSSEHWDVAALHLETVLQRVSGRASADAHYQLGVCQFRRKEWDFAAEEFTKALELQEGDSLTEPTLGYLFAIAEKFRLGAKHRLFGLRKLPKWSSDSEVCLHLYNLISETLPYSELAANSLLSKGKYLRALGEYSRSNEALHALIEVFAGSAGALDARAEIALNMKEMIARSPGDDDLLAQAQANFEDLQKEFPKAEEAIATARGELHAMRALAALDLSQTASYYEKKRQVGAARIYYEQITQQFPETIAARNAQKRLAERPFTS